MFEQIAILSYLHTKRIKNKIDAFATRKLCGRNKIAVSSNKNNLRNLTLI